MATVSNVQEQTTCTICKGTFKSPLQLPCKHTFCLECVSTKASDVQEGKVTCPKCQKTCDKLDCIEDTKAKHLIELYDTCTDGKKQSNSNFKFHLPKRKLSKKHNITFEEMKEKKSGSEGFSQEVTHSQGSIEQSTGDKTVLTKASPLRPTTSTSSSSSNDSEHEQCPICMKHSAKWICMKCYYKSCNPCCQNYPLLCKDKTSNHTFVEADSFCQDTDVSDKLQIVPSSIPPVIEENERTSQPPTADNTGQTTAITSHVTKKVTFKDIGEENESTTDEFKPRFRDSIALTKDKKKSLEDIIGEVHKIEETARETTDSLQCYHQYMKEVKTAGFNLIQQTQHAMINKVQQFFSNLQEEYESGFDEMTGMTEQLHRNIDDKLKEIQGNSSVLEEIVENNDTRVLLDEEFLSDKCGDLDSQITELGKNIVQCKRAGLPNAKEWDEKKKLEFEKQMNVHILTATEKELKGKLLPEMTATVNEMKPVIKTEVNENLKRKKLLECVLC